MGKLGKENKWRKENVGGVEVWEGGGCRGFKC